MHVISCRVRDAVCIGDSVRIEVLEIAEHRIRLGIASPHQFPEYQEQVIHLADDSDCEAVDLADFNRGLVEI